MATIGLDRLYYATVTEAPATGEETYGTPVMLAKAISAGTGIPYDKRALHKPIENRPQHKLGRMERMENISGVFAAEGGRVKSRRLLLVDDVCTTGATLAECSRILLKAGAKSVTCLVAALAP